MKILLINKYFYIKGGSERCFLDEAKLLEKNGHKVVVFAMKDKNNLPTSYEKYFVNNIDFNANSIFDKIKGAFHLIYSFEAKRKLEELIKLEKPDIAHLHLISHQISPSILHTLKKYNIPVVHTMHNYELICPNNLMYGKNGAYKKCSFWEILINNDIKNSLFASAVACVEHFVQKIIRIYDNVNIFIAPSKFMANITAQYGINPNKIVYIPNSLNISDYTPEFTNKNYILFFGRLSEEKGVDTAIKAMSLVGSDIKLKIAGTGDEMPALKNLAIKHNVEKNIEFLGFKNQNELKALISGAAFVIMPSKWYENAPYSVLESFAYGKPVIGSNIGGIPELVENGKTGLIIKPGDANDLAEKINYLSSNKDLIIQMGKNAREKLEQEFNENLHYSRIMNIYEKLVK